ncbi:MAG TPA: thioredoxin domain-containing protein [Candidatus Nanoarchaeia archaeon]|nr:thioredoxin domain-containing protein [Candidatus Nanoarchaeia archaeon]
MKKYIFISFLFLMLLISACSTSQETQPARVNIDSGIRPGEIKTFAENPNAEVCTQDNKQVIRLFSTSWCPHCKWIKGRFDTVMHEYISSGKIVAYHWELDLEDDILTEAKEGAVPAAELELFKQFNPQQSIPTFVMGCKYYRIGNGYESQNNLDAEETELRSVIEKLIQEAGQ